MLPSYFCWELLWEYFFGWFTHIFFVDPKVALKEYLNLTTWLTFKGRMKSCIYLNYNDYIILLFHVPPKSCTNLDLCWCTSRLKMSINTSFSNVLFNKHVALCKLRLCYTPYQRVNLLYNIWYNREGGDSLTVSHIQNRHSHQGALQCGKQPISTLWAKISGYSNIKNDIRIWIAKTIYHDKVLLLFYTANLFVLNYSHLNKSKEY